MNTMRKMYRSYWYHSALQSSSEMVRDYDPHSTHEFLIARGFAKDIPSASDLAQLRMLRDIFNDCFQVDQGGEVRDEAFNVNWTEHALYDDGLFQECRPEGENDGVGDKSNRQKLEDDHISTSFKFEEMHVCDSVSGIKNNDLSNSLLSIYSEIRTFAYNRYIGSSLVHGWHVYEDDSLSLFLLSLIQLTQQLAKKIRACDSQTSKEVTQFAMRIKKYTVEVRRKFIFSIRSNGTTRSIDSFLLKLASKITTAAGLNAEECAKTDLRGRLEDYFRARNELTSRLGAFLDCIFFENDREQLPGLRDVFLDELVREFGVCSSVEIAALIRSDEEYTYRADIQAKLKYIEVLFDYELPLYMGQGLEYYSKQGPRYLKAYIQELVANSGFDDEAFIEDFSVTFNEVMKHVSTVHFIDKTFRLLNEVLTNDGEIGLFEHYNYVLYMIKASKVSLTSSEAAWVELNEKLDKFEERIKDWELVKLKKTPSYKKLIGELRNVGDSLAQSVTHIKDIVHGIDDYIEKNFGNQEAREKKARQAADNRRKLFQVLIPQVCSHISQHYELEPELASKVRNMVESTNRSNLEEGSERYTINIAMTRHDEHFVKLKGMFPDDERAEFELALDAALSIHHNIANFLSLLLSSMQMLNINLKGSHTHVFSTISIAIHNLRLRLEDLHLNLTGKSLPLSKVRLSDLVNLRANAQKKTGPLFHTLGDTVAPLWQPYFSALARMEQAYLAMLVHKAKADYSYMTLSDDMMLFKQRTVQEVVVFCRVIEAFKLETISDSVSLAEMVDFLEADLKSQFAEYAQNLLSQDLKEEEEVVSGTESKTEAKETSPVTIDQVGDVVFFRSADGRERQERIEAYRDFLKGVFEVYLSQKEDDGKERLPSHPKIAAVNFAINFISQSTFNSFTAVDQYPQYATHERALNQGQLGRLFNIIRACEPDFTQEDSFVELRTQLETLGQSTQCVVT